jgi:hypothetical protein
MTINILQNISRDLQTLIWSFFLYVAYLLVNYLIYKKKGVNFSPITNILFKSGYELTFGIVVASPFLIAVLIVSVLFALHDIHNFLVGRLIVNAIFIYLFLSILVNLWGQWFLKSKGVNPKPDGWKGFWKRVKENAERYKNEHNHEQR